MKISLKYKFLITLMIVNSIGLYGYLFMAKDLFHRDKTIYTMNALEINTSNIGHIIDSQILRATTFLNVAPNLRDNNVKQVLEKEMPFLVAVLTSRQRQPIWVRRGAANNNKIFEKFVEYRDEYKKLAVNTFIPFTGGYGIFLVENEVGFLTLLIDFNKTLESVVKNDAFKISFFSSSVASWLEKDRNISDELLKRIKGSKSEHTRAIVTELHDRIESAYRSHYGVYVVASVLKKDALVVLDELSEKSFYYFLIFLSLTGVVSVLVTNRLTHGLRQLYDATREISKENYDLSLNISSGDEVEELGNSFVDMSSKIQHLLMELRDYNEMLEQMVMERTLHLNKALNLQKAMVDSLDEGFFILNEEGNVGELRSMATKEIFDRDITGLSLANLLELEESEESFSEFLGLVFTGDLPPESAFELLPEKVFINSGKLLYVRYSLITQISEESDFIKNVVAGTDEIANIVCVVSDKTEEYKMEQKLKIEKDFANVVMNIISNSQKYREFVVNFIGIINELRRVHEIKDVKIELFRKVHTYKAHSNYMGLATLAEGIHVLESKLDQAINSDECDFSGWSELVDKVDCDFRNWLIRLELLSGVDKDGNMTKSDIKLSEDSLKKVACLVDDLPVAIASKSKIISNLLSTSIKEAISNYKMEIRQFSMDIDHKVELRVTGQDAAIYQPLYKGFLEQLIHLFRNSVDHGYDGKDLVLTADLSIDEKLQIRYFDNGKGLNLSKLKQKLQNLNISFSTDEEVAQCIFMDQLSTNDEVTITAGRGVGMSALKDAIVKMGGTVLVELASEGFACLIELPLYTDEIVMNSVLEWANESS